ncbi:MAG: hypothetical protein ABR500_15435 [Dermatophilaceae bacterium]|nr:hypothetical protein [Intrasporangiaceae bacterium]
MHGSPTRERTIATSTVVFALVWLAALTAMQWSVVRYRSLIVAVLLITTVALWVWVTRRATVRITPSVVAALGLGTASVTLVVPVFTYAVEPARTWILVVHAVGVLLVTAILLTASRPTGRRGPLAAIGVVALTHTAIAAFAIRHSPAPRIDVWVVLQQAADAMALGENIFGRAWVGSPGVDDAFTYLPWTAVLLAPGRLVGGDVRWALLGWTLLGLVGIWRLAGPARWVAAAIAMLVLLAPGTLTQVDQAWTEPLLLTLVIWWAVLVQRGHAWWAVLPLALACASKQHLALLLPILLVWRGFGPARTVATGALAAAFMTPWIAANPGAFLHDTVILLVEFHPIRFANTLYLLALNVFGVTLPFWLTGLVVAAALGTAVWLARRPQVDLASVLRICAAVLLTASMVNKQAFYNQFWLVAGLVAVSLAVEEGQRLRPSRS